MIEVLSEEYINPFGADVPMDKLFNLSSGTPVSDDIATAISEVQERGISVSDTFRKERLEKGSVKFHSPLPTQVTTFSPIKKKLTLEKNGKTKRVDANRSFLSRLVHYAMKPGKSVDYEEALKHPLSVIPASLSHGDGTKRKNNKSELTDLVLGMGNKVTRSSPRNEETAYIVDLIAVLYTMTAIPGTFEQLAWKILQNIPVGYHRVDIVADSYLEKSIKEGERASRSNSSKVIIKSKHSNIPRDFKEFLGNGSNNNRMVEIIFGVITDEKEVVCSKLKSNEVIRGILQAIDNIFHFPYSVVTRARYVLRPNTFNSLLIS